MKLIKNSSIAALAILPASIALAHGTMLEPPARQEVCHRDNPEDPQIPVCQDVVKEYGTLSLYDPYAVAQADANSNHQKVVPDGKLCSGNAGWYLGYDMVRDDWPSTPIIGDANGEFTFKFQGTAPHATKDWIFYVTKPGYNNEALSWDGLEEFCRLGNIPVEKIDGVKGGIYSLQCKLPERTGKHVIYNVWQRFYQVKNQH